MRLRNAGAGTALLLVAAVIGAGCGQSTQDAEEQLCAELANFKSSVQQLRTANPETTSADQFQQQFDNVKKSWAQLKDAAANLGEDDIDDVEDAWDDLTKSVKDVDDKDSVSEAVTDIQSAAAEFDQALQELDSELDCSTS
jgi:predicted negative regulator of RcsB-dependent stress response